MIVGFTGTQSGMTAPQLLSVRKILQGLRDEQDASEFHHGNCIGADEEAALIAKELGLHVVAHPGNNPEKQSTLAFCSDDFLGVLPNLERNRAIVDASDVIVGTPKGPERQRSGTWSTLRYAERQHKAMFVVRPDGYVGAILQVARV